jgi:hypothetical protein
MALSTTMKWHCGRVRRQPETLKLLPNPAGLQRFARAGVDVFRKV